MSNVDIACKTCIHLATCKFRDSMRELRERIGDVGENQGLFKVQINCNEYYSKAKMRDNVPI